MANQRLEAIKPLEAGETGGKSQVLSGSSCNHCEAGWVGAGR